MSVLRIKNWEKFQHFKDRRPPWVKLYRDILDDPDWFDLDPKAAKILVMLWLIASEDDGFLPEAKKLAFRLRTTEQEVEQAVISLSQWIEVRNTRDIDAISTRYQVDVPETEKRQRQRQSTGDHPLFEDFWSAYPRKDSKATALKAFSKIAPDEQLFAKILAGVQRAVTSEQWRKDGGKFIPYAATWLNQERWTDGGTSADAGVDAEYEDMMRGAI
jgi:hypothetical protein